MPDSFRATRESALRHVDALIRRGEELLQHAAKSPRIDADQIRAWQQQCGDAMTHLSGGSKAHWLARAFSHAFLVRSDDGRAIVEAPAQEIIGRLVDVLMQARASLMEMTEDAIEDASRSAWLKPSRDETALHGDTPPQRFAFVHRRELQPVLERAYADSRAAFDRGDIGPAFVLTCTVLEAIITDALEHAAAQSNGGASAGERIAEMPFDARIAAAERAGLIRGGCARLPAIALRYRDFLDDRGALDAGAIVLPRDARVAGQVLRVVVRDLDPGR